jgi:hypothetical protein
VVSYVTTDPSDHLALVNKDWYTSIKGGFDTTERSVSMTVNGAIRTGPVDEMGPGGHAQRMPSNFARIDSVDRFRAIGGIRYRDARRGRRPAHDLRREEQGQRTAHIRGAGPHDGGYLALL